MTTYTSEDILRGAGAFEQAVASQQAIPGRGRMSPGMAIGVLSAAMRSGLPASKLDSLIDGSFASNAILLKRVLGMYEGDNWALTLWHRLSTNRYKLCTDLCRQGLVGWRYDPTAASLDD